MTKHEAAITHFEMVMKPHIGHTVTFTTYPMIQKGILTRLSREWLGSNEYEVELWVNVGYKFPVKIYWNQVISCSCGM